MHIGSDVHVDQTWGSVTVHRRWGCVDRRSNRSKVEGKLTMGLPKARWSDYREGSAVRWARHDRSGTNSAFGSWLDRWLVLWLDRRLVRGWIDVWFAHWICVWFMALSFSRSLSLLVCWALSFSGSLSLLRMEGNGLKVKWICKMISGSNEQNFGQTEIIFRKFYFS